MLERKSSPRSSRQFSCTVPDLPGTRSTQAGRGMFLPSRQVYDASELMGALSASVLVVPYVLVNPQHLHACEAGGVIRCGLQTRLDVGPHGIPRGCQLSGQERWWLLRSATVGSPSGSPGSADAPWVRTSARHVPGMSPSGRWFRGISSAVLCHRNLAGTPGPGRVDDLRDHAPVALYDSARNPGAPPAGCTTQYRVPAHLGCEPRSSPSKPTSRS